VRKQIARKQLDESFDLGCFTLILHQ
jgi:hypothetical protein